LIRPTSQPLDPGETGLYSKLIVDLDGTLYCGPSPIPGALQAMETLRERHSILFLSNNGSLTASKLAARLRGMGFEAHRHEVISSLDLMVDAIGELGRGLRVLPMTSGDLPDALEEAGHRVVEGGNADVVAAGVDVDFGYETLSCALWALSSGAVLIGANEDATYPTERGLRPAAGAFVGAMRGMGFSPERLCGKPDARAMRRALALRGFEPDPECLLVGDRPDSDVLGAHALAIDSALVLTGITDARAAANASPSPTYVIESICELASRLRT